MIKKQGGFTMVELLVSMVMFLFVIAAASEFFTAQLTQFKQQSKITETNIEGIIGLELLRQDIKHAGYGLPWDMNGANYDEAGNDGRTLQDETIYNDEAANDPPRALVSGNGDGDGIVGPPGSDVLVIKATNVATSEASRKWTHLSTGNTVRKWTPKGERLEDNARVIVISPGTTRTLELDAGGNFTARYDAHTDPTPDTLTDAAFAPFSGTGTRLVYGVTPPANTALRMPFNRADYYVRTPLPANMPDRCAVGTGVLYKATVNHANGVLTELPVFDCVADIQVVYRLDTDDDGVIDGTTDDISTLSAENIRDQVKEVWVDVLAHEGQKDSTYTHATNPVTVGAWGAGRSFDFSAASITDWKNYRWKLYKLVVTPENLG